MDENWGKKNIECCACGGTLETSKYINVVETNKLPTWKFPVMGNVAIPGYVPRAIAIICDGCLQNKEKIRHCIEWEGSPYKIKYHEIESLEEIKKDVNQKENILKGKIWAERFLLKAAQQMNEN